jgi:hypothetical protein
LTKRHETHIDLVHRTLDYDFEASGQFAYHLWESLSWSPHLEVLDPDRIHNRGVETGESSFTKVARKLVNDELRDSWRNARRRGDI